MAGPCAHHARNCYMDPACRRRPRDRGDGARPTSPLTSIIPASADELKYGRQRAIFGSRSPTENNTVLFATGSRIRRAVSQIRFFQFWEWSWRRGNCIGMANYGAPRGDLPPAHSTSSSATARIHSPAAGRIHDYPVIALRSWSRIF